MVVSYQETTILRCITSQKSADLIYIAVEAWNHTGSWSFLKDVFINGLLHIVMMGRSFSIYLYILS